MKIILASSEVVPFAKTGGLADVTGALPRELEKLGHEVTVFTPGYRCTAAAGLEMEATEIAFEIPLGNQLQSGRLAVSNLPDSNCKIYFVQHDEYFHREGLYGDKRGAYVDNCERFVFFCRAILESVRELKLQPDVIHANDWQTGLLPALLKCEYQENPEYADIVSLITIHNLAYQGLFEASSMALTGLDPKLFNWEQMEFFGHLNLLKTGIIFADSVNTVSPTYATEIQSTEQGCGLEGVLQFRADRLSGILNGIDTNDWNPATDSHLPHHFDATSIGGKAACKRELQIEAKLEPREDVPLIGVVGRLASQKGWSLILPVLRRWLEQEDAQWVILGTGDQDYHHVLTSLHRSHPNKLALTLDFSNPFAHRIEAGSDLFLMPSQYEPCGLNQMYSMAYGTVPVVRRTGGLADTVINANSETLQNGTATGFSFADFSVESLQTCLQRAVETYRHQKDVWKQLMLNGMVHDWSWTSSAKRYESLYEKTIEMHRNR